ncbi:melanocortin receptor 4-like [Acropora millepora]|uniref:melanocortin receptor 4-like n=1 Tax=Acropora millepora TaxID=45264 RepID=UPI001CF31F94|nr:melanocortin receptor 4-like [Acropora millepora]
MSCLERFSYLTNADTSKVAYTILATVAVVLAILTILGNFLVLYALRKCQSLQNSTRALLASLALSDLGIGLFAYPLFVAYCLSIVYNNVDLFCAIQSPYAMVGYCLASVSFFTMTLISLDRFYAVKLRHRYHQVVTIRRVVITLTAFWIFGLAWSFFWLVSESLTGVTVFIIIFCCIIITTVSSVRTYLAIRHHQLQIHAHISQQQGESQVSMGAYKKSLNTMMLIFALLLACYLPYFTVVGVIMATPPSSYTVLAFNVTSTIVYFNSLLNPIVYCVKMRQIRQEVVALLPCFSSENLRRT